MLNIYFKNKIYRAKYKLLSNFNIEKFNKKYINDEISSIQIYADTFTDLTIFKNIKNIESIESFQIINCNFDSLNFIDYPNLISIDIKQCTIKTLNGIYNVNKCINIFSLTFNEVNIFELPNLDNLKKLKTLICIYTNITRIPNLDSCINLKNLKCFNNNLIELPNLDLCNKLENLFISNNNLIKIPNLVKCVSLLNFVCNFNNLVELPIFNNNLESLYITNNNLIYLNDISYLHNLKSIDISFNNILELYNKDLNFQYLTEFICSYNKIEILPNFINCINLNILICNNNNIVNLPRLPINLDFLNIKQNLLNNINTIYICNKIRHLDLSFNNMIELSNINNMNNLEKLYFNNNNNIIKFPKINKLINLYNIKCYQNCNIKNIDLSIIKCKKICGYQKYNSYKTDNYLSYILNKKIYFYYYLSIIAYYNNLLLF